MSYLFHLCTWNSETNKCLCLSTSDTTVPKGWRKNMGGPHSSRIMHRTLVLCDGAARIITKHTYKCTTCVWALWWISFPSMCLSNAPNQLPNHNIHRDIKLEFVMLAYYVLPKKLPNSGHFPHWRQLWHHLPHLQVSAVSHLPHPLLRSWMYFFSFSAFHPLLFSNAFFECGL